MKKNNILRIGIIQRVLADYRKPFFEKVNEISEGKVYVFCGNPRPDEGLKTSNFIKNVELDKTTNLYLRFPFGMVCWQSSIKKWLKRIDPHVLVVDGNPRMLSHWMAIYWMKRRNRPIFGWGLGELQRTGSSFENMLRQKMVRFLLGAFDGMIAYSSKAKEDYVRLGLREDCVSVACNSVDNTQSERYLQQLGSDKAWVGKWKRQRNLEPNIPIVLFVGRLIPQKKVNLLIQAYKTLADQCQIVIVGDGPMRGQLEQEALPYGKRVHFEGYKTGEDLAKCFIASDVFVLPGLGGLAIHQAMSYGKPIIVSFGDGTESDLVRMGKNGYLFKTNDSIDLRNNISRLLKKPEKIQKMGQTSLEIIRSEINIEMMAKTFMDCVSYIVKSC